MSAATTETPLERTWERYGARRRGLYLFVLFLVGTSNYLDRNIIGVLLEPIKAEFGASDAMLGLLSGLSFALFYATLGLPVARWADRGDRKLIITLSLAVWSLMTVLCGVAQNFWQLALARVGVGAGEAGAIPPAQSLLVDYFPPERRNKAIGIFLMCSVAGYVLGLSGGGYIAQHYGWRAALLAAGAPGLLLAALAYFVLDEPRHDPAFAARSKVQESMGTALRVLLAKRSFVLVLGALTLYFLMAFGALVFSVPFMIRAHGVTVAQAGAAFGIASAIGGVIGNLAGGAFADRMVAKDPRWCCWLPGIVLIAVWPLYEIAFLASSFWLLLGLLLVAGSGLVAAVPSMFSAMHFVCGSPRRATSVALAFFFANLIGLGLGPIITGALSDRLAPTMGAGDGLRTAMMIVVCVFLPCGWLMLRAARHLRGDMEP